MKIISTFMVSLALAAPASAGGALEAVLANTDPALAAAVRGAQEVLPPPFPVPPPSPLPQPSQLPPPAPIPGPKADPSDPRNTDTPPAEYMPITMRAVFEYEYTSSEFIDPKIIRVEYLSYSEQTKTASVNMVIHNKVNPKVVNYSVTSDSYGIRSSDSPLYGPRLEIPVPLSYNMVWNEGPDRSRAAALNAKITVPAGSYKGCLKVKTSLSGGDAGSAVRYYAPGVGLVYEQIISEEKQETIQLVSYQLK